MDDLRPALQNAGVKPFQSHILVVLWCDEVYPVLQTQASPEDGKTPTVLIDLLVYIVRECPDCFLLNSRIQS